MWVFGKTVALVAADLFTLLFRASERQLAREAPRFLPSTTGLDCSARCPPTSDGPMKIIYRTEGNAGAMPVISHEMDAYFPPASAGNQA